MKDSAFILECRLDEETLSGLSIDEEVKNNMFGSVRSKRVSNSKGDNAIIYEEGGMNGIRNFPKTHLPVYSDIYLRGIKNVHLLGFCGSLDPNVPIGSFVIPQDFIDLTKNRTRSFIEELKGGESFYYRMVNPYSPTLVKYLTEVSTEINPKTKLIQDYIVTEGPRFETASEIKFYQKMNGCAVCFSGAPDAYFARELDLNLAVGLFVSNMGEGIRGSQLSQILETSANQTKGISEIVKQLLSFKIDKLIDLGFHDSYWMQRPSKEVYELIK